MIGRRSARLLFCLALGLIALSHPDRVEGASPEVPVGPAPKPAATPGTPPGTAPGAPTGATPGLGLGNGGRNDRRPLDIQASDGIEWQQENNVYIAHGNAHATRGNATVYADTLIAHYRPAPTAAEKSAESAAPGKQAPGTPPPASTGSTDIYRVDAEGNVRLQTETQTVYGDHAVYDIDRATAVVTGGALRLVTPRDTVTARDSLEWYDNTQVAVARGDAVAIQDQKRLSGDVLTAQVIKPSDGPSRISRVDAQGHVLVSTASEIARGASGVYNVDTGIATLAGGVTITRGGNELKGQYGVVDLNRNISRLLSAPPGSTEGGPVQALIVPRPSAENAPDGTAAPGNQAPKTQRSGSGRSKRPQTGSSPTGSSP